MTTRAMLYCLDIDSLDFTEVARAAGLPKVEPKVDPRSGATYLEFQVGPTQVALLAVPHDETREQLEGMAKYVTGECELLAPDLLSGLQDVRAGLELAFEPGMDEAGACERFLRALAVRAKAFVYRDDGSLESPSGETIARPRQAAARKPLQAPVHLEPLPEPQPPPAGRVGRRALVVVGLAWRSVVERRKPDNRAELVAGYRAWLERLQLWDEMEPAEAALARAEPGAWTEADIVQASWSIEGAAVLAWALRLAELPAHDAQVDSSALGHALGLFAAAPPALAAPGLRPVQELGAMVRRLMGLHWRLRTFTDSPGRVDFVAFARGCATGSFDPEGIRLARGDLAIGEQPLWAAPERAIAQALSIAVERHRAATWLAGLSPTWSGSHSAAP